MKGYSRVSLLGPGLCRALCIGSRVPLLYPPSIWLVDHPCIALYGRGPLENHPCIVDIVGPLDYFDALSCLSVIGHGPTS